MMECFKKLKHQTSLVFKRDEKISELGGSVERREKELQAMKSKLEAKKAELAEL